MNRKLETRIQDCGVSANELNGSFKNFDKVKIGNIIDTYAVLKQLIPIARDEESSMSGIAITLQRKRKSLGLGHLSVGEKQAIVCMSKRLITCIRKINTTAIVTNISENIGTAKSTVYHTINEYNSMGK